MTLDTLSHQKLSWHWPAALSLFMFAIIGFSSGVSLTERPEVIQSSLLAKAYYSLGLFVVGGMDIGVPTGGPLYGRVLLWLAYFGSPLLTASAVIEAVLRVVSPQGWKLRRLNNHIVIVGAGNMTVSYLRVLRLHSPNIPVVVVDHTIDRVRELEFAETFDVSVVVGDITHDFLLRALKLKRAQRVILMGNNDFHAFEAASKILRLYPHLASRVILHCSNLRFLRAMQETSIAKLCVNFNTYNLAAKGLVRDQLLAHFEHTVEKDIVVLAGFGLFGQTILEELLAKANEQIEMVGIIDVNAYNRVEIVDEQQKLGNAYKREVLQGNVAHPEVWRQLEEKMDLTQGEPVIILGTGDSANNLRTSLWIKQKYPNALIFTRTDDVSQFAKEVCEEHDINSISITQLLEDNIPLEWLG
ncbi:MAG: NAD-binding protein [Pseudomonadales bacterium]|nr:NAD-binding protein [Pseudomonadales bacterium]